MIAAFKLGFWECGDRNPIGRKYIITGDDKRQVMWIFPASLTHQEVALRKKRGTIIAAGFIRDDDGFIECYGESTSLHVRSRKEDSKLLTEALS